jgi:hypothetical protein
MVHGRLESLGVSEAQLLTFEYHTKDEFYGKFVYKNTQGNFF